MTDSFTVLPRELFDLPDDVANTSAPRTPVLAEPYHVRLVDPDRDTDLITEWMHRPHLVQAWERPWPPEKWRNHLGLQLDGEYSRPLIAGFEGRDYAYLELYRPAKDHIAPGYEARADDVGVHAAIAEPAIVNKGFAVRLMPKMIDAIFAAEPACERVIFDPDSRNTGAQRLCEFVGCTFVGEYRGATATNLIYAYSRPA